ncbi:hypothetical protein [Kitasatospora sp. NPDC005856]|uniref:hypothetical protein n=1 Tax=Kitasatospora sp. NPDC005856 TaxID=3154566 RepID=UPI0033DE5645
MTDRRQPVVVSGVTRGLGRAPARRFAALGHPVAGCGRSAGALSDLASEPGDGHRFERVDGTDAEWVDAWAENAVDYLLHRLPAQSDATGLTVN